MFKSLNEKVKRLSPIKIIIIVLLEIVAGFAVGFLLLSFVDQINDIVAGKGFHPDFAIIKEWKTWGVGWLTIIVFILFTFFGDSILKFFGSNTDHLLSSDAQRIDTGLENSRFLTEKERDANFPHYTYDNMKDVKKDGVPIRAVLDKKGMLQCNFLPGTHSLVIGATGSGKTTTFINPMIQLLGAADCGSSMIMTDPKGELFDLHSKFLHDRGYDVLILDLRDTYASSRWNPLGSIWDMYREYSAMGKGIKIHRDNFADYPSLTSVGGEPIEPGTIWAEVDGKAYSDLRRCQDEVSVARQKVYDEMYEDLADLVAGICPITNEKDPLWEKGARSIITATCLAMLEDSEDERLGMSKEKFNFYNINKILSNSENNYEALKNYFEGRSTLSQAYTLSRQVLAAADQTLSSYMSITFDKLSIFNDQGICGLTSDTDIHAEQFADRPTALFLKIPDEKDTRHGIASLFILSMYKALIKVASAREDLSLPRNVYFILDEFGNMPKIEKFGQMITVGRSRKIWFHMVVQSYSQLNNVYGETVADIVKSNCGMKMFIGSNDIGTCKEFSELCGNMTVKTTSTSSQLNGKEDSVSLSSQTQVRPLIYPSELQKLNNKQSTGNAIIVTFGNFPLKTKYTPSYLCPFYKFGRMSSEDMRVHMFIAEEVFYDVAARNRLILEEEE